MCKKNNPVGSVFCSSCGYKFNKKNRKPLYFIIGIVVGLVLLLAFIIAYKNSLKSPIQGVSKKIYEQGQSYLNQMDTPAVESAVAKYLKKHSDESVNDISHNISGITFEINLGKNPTVEECYYAELIDKFWEAKATCYAHRAILAQYADDDSEGVSIALSLYKGIISDFEDRIKQAKRKLPLHDFSIVKATAFFYFSLI